MDTLPDAPTDSWQSLMCGAINRGDLARMQQLLAIPAKIPDILPSRSQVMAFPLVMAVQKGFWEGAQLLADAGASAHYVDSAGCSALHACASAPAEHWPAALRLARDLLARGARTKHRDDGTDFTLGDAIFVGHVAFVALLAEHEVLTTTGTRHDWLLNMAINCPAPFEMVTTLARGGVSMRTDDPDDISLLHGAAQKGLWELCDFLCDQGLDANAPDHNGGTPLHVACVLQQTAGVDPEATAARVVATVQTLLRHGANLEARDVLEQTPLCAATDHRKRTLLAEALLDAGADIHARDGAGLTPLHLAAIIPATTENVRLLLERGADPLLLDHAGNTPEMLAWQRGCPEVAQVIRTFVQAPLLEQEIAQAEGPAKRLRV